MISTRTALAGAVAAGALAVPAPALAAEAFYGVTAENALVTFHSDSPARIRTSVPITGLQEGEQVLAADVRAATGQLHLLGSTNRLYRVSTASGAATPLGNPFEPALAGTSFGADFDPTDRLRIFSNGRQNLRLHPENGQVTSQDHPLEYAAGDPGAGAIPQVNAIAFTPGPEPKLFGIDAGRDTLVTTAAPSGGILNTVGALGKDVGDVVAFDVAADGAAYVAAQVAPDAGPSLLRADLATGALVDATGLRSIGTRQLRAIAAAGPVPDDGQRPSLLVAAERTQTKASLRRRLTVAVSCSEACGLTGELLRGSRRIGSGTASLANAGRTSIKIDATSARRALAKRRGRVTLTLRVRAIDAAGNRTIVRRSVRFG